MRPIDADELKEWVEEYHALNWGIPQDELIYAIGSAPTIDAVPVVRCNDCKYWREETDHTCQKWGGASPRNANGYCDDGERSEE